MSPLCRLLLPATLVLTLGAPGHARPDKKQADSAGDPLPEGALLRMGSMRLRHADNVTGVALSPDGKLVASADYFGVVRVWDTSSGMLRFELPKGTGNVVAFSRDGVLATGGTEIILWDAATGQRVRRMDNKPVVGVTVASLAFSDDGKSLVTAAGGQGLSNFDPVIRLWDATTGKQIRTFEGPANGARAVALSPDGKFLLTGGGDRGKTPRDTALRLWDVETGKELKQLPGHKSWVDSVAFSRDGKIMASACAFSVLLWDAKTGRLLHTLEKASHAVAFSPTADLLAVGSPLGLFDPNNGNSVMTMAGAADVQCVAFSGDGRLIASGSRDGRVRLWTTKGQELLRPGGHEAAVSALAFSPDGAVVASSSGRDDSVRIWGTATGARLRKISVGNPTDPQWRDNELSTLAFSPDGRTVATWSRSGTIFVWDLGTGRTRELKLGEVWTAAVAFSADGKRIAVVTSDGPSRAYVVAVHDAATGREVHRFAPFRGPARRGAELKDLAFSPDGTLLAVAGMAEVDRGAGKVAAQDTVWLFDPASGEPVRRFRQSTSTPSHVTFSPDGRLLAAELPDGTVQLFDVADGADVRKLGTPDPRRPWNTPPVGFAFSADGKLLALGDEHGRVTVYETRTGKEVRSFAGHKQAVTALAFSPDGKALASGGADTTVLLWRLDAGKKGEGEKKADPPDNPDQAWADLADPNPVTAYAALLALGAGGDRTVAFLRARLKPAPPRGPEETARWIAELGKDDADHRAAAVRELRLCGRSAAPALFDALRGRPDPKARKEIERLLEVLDEQGAAPEVQQALRALQVLEQIGTPEAEKLLRSLAEGAPSAEATRDARAALVRLEARRSLQPFHVLTDDDVVAERRHVVGGRAPRTMAEQVQGMSTLAFSADGKLLATGGDGRLFLWDPAARKLIRSWEAGRGKAHGLALSPSGKLLASAGPDKMVRVWDTVTGKVKHELAGHTGTAACVAFSPDGKLLASGGCDGAVRIWDIGEGKCLHEMPTKVKKVLSVAFALDGRTLASGGIRPERDPFAGGISYSQPGPVQLWDVTAGTETATLPVSGSHVALGPDGRTLVAGGAFVLIEADHKGGGFIGFGNTTCFAATRLSWYDLVLKREGRRLQGMGCATAFSPDGRLLVSGVSGHTEFNDQFMWGTNIFGWKDDDEHALRLWDNLTGKELLLGERKEARAVQVSPDGRTVAWIDEGGIVRLWDLTPEKPLAKHPNGLAAKDLEALWKGLLSDDGPAALQAVFTLAGDPAATVAFLKERLKPARGVDEKRLARLITDLNDEQFDTREAARRELEQLNVLAEPALLKALADKPPIEVEKRIEELLRAIRSEPQPEELRCLWAVHVLERIATPEARRLLEALAEGSPQLRQTAQARSALERLKK
jgi:WD40 repeat protein